MIKNLKILWIFYMKLLIPTVLFSLLFAFQTGFIAGNFGFCFLMILPAFHYLVYELRLKQEYFFFAHFGFSRSFLWIATASIGFTVNIISKFL